MALFSERISRVKIYILTANAKAIATISTTILLADEGRETSVP